MSDNFRVRTSDFCKLCLHYFTYTRTSLALMAGSVAAETSIRVAGTPIWPMVRITALASRCAPFSAMRVACGATPTTLNDALGCEASVCDSAE